MAILGFLEVGLGNLGPAQSPVLLCLGTWNQNQDRENDKGHVPTSFLLAQGRAVGGRSCRLEKCACSLRTT